MERQLTTTTSPPLTLYNTAAQGPHFASIIYHSRIFSPRDPKCPINRSEYKKQVASITLEALMIMAIIITTMLSTRTFLEMN